MNNPDSRRDYLYQYCLFLLNKIINNHAYIRETTLISNVIFPTFEI